MKKLKKENLEKANGGMTTNETFFTTCNSCGEYFACNGLNLRTVGEGCDSKAEYQCPKCKTWNNPM